MAGSSICYLRDIQTLFDSGTASSLSDRQLLERFLSDRDGADETAFEVLVLAAWADGVASLPERAAGPDRCRGRVSGDLSGPGSASAGRSAGSNRSEAGFTAWRSGLRPVHGAMRRGGARPNAGGACASWSATDHGDGSDPERRRIRARHPGEVRRLPEKYRSVVVLCYWQGLNQEQAAARLGCPLGTVRSRLARARRFAPPAADAPRTGAARRNCGGRARSHLGIRTRRCGSPRSRPN